MRFLKLISRFGLAGLLNTLIGLLVILTLDLGFGLPPLIANAIGYAIGISIGFFLSRGYVFQDAGRASSSGFRYSAAVVTAFGANQSALLFGQAFLDGMPVAHLGLQLFGMTVYTTVLFALCRWWVFQIPKSNE